MLLGRLFLAGARLPRPGLCALGALASLPLVPAFVFGFGPLQDVMFWPAFGVLLLALAQGGSAPARALGTPVLVALGEASYGLYILHWGVWDDLQRLDLASPQAGGWPYFLAYAALMIALALLSLRLLEAPARRRLRQVLAGRQTAPRSLQDTAR
jgi:peptidoglycan/LPS O-acetylase OafA/YrhL